jgi:hypothetical protein
MALPIPSPSALLDLGRYAVGQVVETAASIATVPVRVMALLGQTELLVSRITLLADSAEELIARVAVVVAEADAVAKRAAGVVTEADLVAAGAARTVEGAALVVGEAGGTSSEAAELLASYAGTLRQAAPLAARFVHELTPEEVTAAIRMVDELPRLRHHLSNDVMPLLGKLDQVGPDLHSLLEVTQDLHLAIAGLPGLKKLRRRGEEKIAAEEEAAALSD